MVLGVSSVFLCGITLVITFYKEVYDAGPTFYINTDILIAVLYAPLRAKLSFNSPCGWLTVTCEACVTLLCTISALFAQCNLLGIRYIHGTAEQDFYHGNWHFLLAIGTSIVYARCAQITVVIAESSTPKCITPRLDFVGLAGIALYAGLLIIFKEMRVELEVVKSILAVIAFLLCGYAIFTLVRYCHLSKKRI